jgi:hypothetical protein
MPQLVTLAEDGPLGAAGTRVWVNDEDTTSTEPLKSKPKKPTAS